MFLQKIQEKKRAMELAVAEQQEEMDLDQLDARYPVSCHIEGLCNFVIHDKDKTPIQKLFPENNGFKFCVERLNKDDVQVKYFELKGGQQNKLVFQHWCKYELDHDRAFQHIRYLASNTLPMSDTTQVNLDVRFDDGNALMDFIRFYEYGRFLAHYTGVRFGKRN